MTADDVPAPIDVVARLRALGLVPASEEEMASDFWKQQCPRRSNGLPHEKGRVWAKCIACGLVPPPRVRASGDGGSTEPKAKPPEPVNLTDSEVEPKMITGEGPQGNPYDYGRGPMGPRFEARLVSYDRYVRRRGEVSGD